MRSQRARLTDRGLGEGLMWVGRLLAISQEGLQASQHSPTWLVTLTLCLSCHTFFTLFLPHLFFSLPPHCKQQS